MLDQKNLFELARVTAKAQKGAPTAYSFGENKFSYAELNDTLRKELNEYYKSNSGNIGYKIRPSKRNLGYGNKILALALEECKKIGMKKVVLHCYDYNEYSIKVIKNNNGVLTFKDNDIEIYEIKIGEE